jgi:hypothetical protein
MSFCSKMLKMKITSDCEKEDNGEKQSTNGNSG